MVKKEQKLRIGDNSDAKVALCIHTNNKKNFIKKSSLGNFIKVTLKRRVSRRKTIKNKVNWALVCSTKQKLQRLSGESLQFKAAKITIVDEKKKKSQWEHASKARFRVRYAKKLCFLLPSVRIVQFNETFL
jgi:ribosomal protein L14